MNAIESEVFAFADEQIKQGCTNSLQLERLIVKHFPSIFPMQAHALVRVQSAKRLAEREQKQRAAEMDLACGTGSKLTNVRVQK